MKSFKEYVISETVPKAFQYQIENAIPLAHNIFRPHTENYYALFRYARENVSQLQDLSEVDHMLIDSDIGEFGFFGEDRVPLDHPFIYEEDSDDKKVELNKPKRGGNKKYYVYVKSEKGNVIKVEFGDTSGLTAKINDPAARKSFAARHQCHLKKDKTKPGYWACRLPLYASELGLKGGGKFYW